MDSKLIARPPSLLPVWVEQELRRALIDKFTGNVEINIKNGRIMVIRRQEIIAAPD